MERALFAAGCFWGPEDAYRKVPGVTATAVGYSGGHMTNPTYPDVCTGNTGHAETVMVEYDPERVSYEQLLEVFWAIHDPTQVNRQGPDIGSQYRSAIFFQNEEQKTAAENSMAVLKESGKLRGTLATELTAAGDFFMAEDYHQQYVEKRSRGFFQRG